MRKVVVERVAGEWVATVTGGTIVARGPARAEVVEGAHEYGRTHGDEVDGVSIEVREEDGSYEVLTTYPRVAAERR